MGVKRKRSAMPYAPSLSKQRSPDRSSKRQKLWPPLPRPFPSDHLTKILPEKLYLSPYNDDIHPDFTHVVNVGLQKNSIFNDPEERVYCHIPLDAHDREGFNRSITTVIEFINQGVNHGRVLIHCDKGINRCSAAVIAYLFLVCTRDLNATQLLKTLHSYKLDAKPDPKFLEMIDDFFASGHGRDMRMASQNERILKQVNAPGVTTAQVEELLRKLWTPRYPLPPVPASLQNTGDYLETIKDNFPLMAIKLHKHTGGKEMAVDRLLAEKYETDIREYVQEETQCNMTKLLEQLRITPPHQGESPTQYLERQTLITKAHKRVYTRAETQAIDELKKQQNHLRKIKMADEEIAYYDKRAAQYEAARAAGLHSPAMAFLTGPNSDHDAVQLAVRLREPNSLAAPLRLAWKRTEFFSERRFRSEGYDRTSRNGIPRKEMLKPWKPEHGDWGPGTWEPAELEPLFGDNPIVWDSSPQEGALSISLEELDTMFSEEGF